MINGSVKPISLFYFPLPLYSSSPSVIALTVKRSLYVFTHHPHPHPWSHLQLWKLSRFLWMHSIISRLPEKSHFQLSSPLTLQSPWPSNPPDLVCLFSPCFWGASLLLCCLLTLFWLWLAEINTCLFDISEITHHGIMSLLHRCLSSHCLSTHFIFSDYTICSKICIQSLITSSHAWQLHWHPMPSKHSSPPNISLFISGIICFNDHRVLCEVFLLVINSWAGHSPVEALYLFNSHINDLIISY